MLNINDNLSFKANIVTNLKGRDNVVGRISKSFAEKSNGIKGSLLIKRGHGDYKGSLVCTLGRVKDSPEYFIGDYDKFLSKEAKDVSQQKVDSLAGTLVKIFQILKQEHNYNKEAAKVNDKIRSVQMSKKTNASIFETMKSSNKTSKWIDIYKNLVESNNIRENSLKEQKEHLKETLITESKKIAGDNEPVLDEYIGILADIM